MPPPTNNFDIVYLLTNPSIPGLVKIGMTTRDNVEARMKELYGTGVPAPFERQYACKVAVSDCATIEKALHATERCIPNGMRVFRWVVAFSTERSIPIGMPQRDSIRNGVALDEVNITHGKNNARVHMLHSDRNVTLFLYYRRTQSFYRA